MGRLLAVFFLTAMIHLINTLIYSVRISGVKTGRLATALSLFNVVFLVSSTANMIQGPLLATIVEGAIHRGWSSEVTPVMEREMNFPQGYFAQLDALAGEIRVIIIAATLGTLLGTLLIPYFIKAFEYVIIAFDKIGSVPRVILMALLAPQKLAKYVSVPEPPKLSGKAKYEMTGLPWNFLAANVLVTGIFTVGVLSALYAGALYPGYRASATMLASVVNGIAQVLFATIVDPTAARLTDQALRGKRALMEIKKMAYCLALTRLTGTVLAQALFLPSAYFIRYVAVLIS